MFPTGNYVWRDSLVDGVPASGSNKPVKADIRAWSTIIENLMGNAVTASLAYATRAALYANLVPVANTPALVVGDPIPTYDGLYVKSGGTGAGSWTQITNYVPGTQFVTAVDVGVGTANAIVATSNMAVGTTNQIIIVDVFETNAAGPVTIRFNGGTVYNLKTASGVDPATASLPARIIGTVSGANFLLLSDTASAAVLAAATIQANAAAASASQAMSYRDAALIAAVTNGYFPAAQTNVPRGIVLGAVAVTAAGSAGTNGTFALAFTGGNLSVSPVGTFTVAGGVLTAISITSPGLYVGASITVPTLSFAASTGLTGATGAALTSDFRVTSGSYYTTDHATDLTLLSLYFRSGSTATISSPLITLPRGEVPNAAINNLWPDPYFWLFRTRRSLHLGREVVNQAGTNGFYDPTAKTVLGTKGAWRISTANSSYMGFNVWFDNHAVEAADVISFGAQCQAAVGENYQAFYRFFGPTPATLLGSQVTGAVTTGTGLLQNLAFDNVTVPASATGVLVFFNDTTPVATNFALLSLWAIRGVVAGASPPKRRPVESISYAIRNVGHTALQSLFPDPTFEVLQNTSVTLGGENLFHSNLTNRTWLPAISHAYGLGAWQHSSASATLTGFKKLFAATGLAAGDTFSVGMIIKADTVGGTVNLAVRQFSSSDITYLGSQTSTSVDIDGNATATGSEQVLIVEGLVVDAAALGVAVYYYDGSPATNINCIAMWIVKGSRAGSMPPPNIHSSLITYIATVAGASGGALAVDVNVPILQPRLATVVGRPLNVRQNNLRIGRSPVLWNFDGTAGGQFNDGWDYLTPAVGTYTLTAEVKDPDTRANKGAKTVTVSVAAAVVSTPTRKILSIGDSLTLGSSVTPTTQWTQRMRDLSASNPTATQITNIGTQGTAPNLHEGQGGWTVDRYWNPGVTYFASNPFTQTSSDKFNFSWYLSNTAQATPDIVCIMLGINDTINAANDAAALALALAAIVKLKEIIGITAGTGVTSLKSVSATIKTILVLEPFGSDLQTPYGNDYGVDINNAQARANIAIFAKSLIDEFGPAGEASNVWLVGAHARIDGVAGYTSSGVHPNAAGHISIGDAVWNFINWGVSTGVM